MQYPKGVNRAPGNASGGMAVEAANLLRAADPDGGWPTVLPVLEEGDSFLAPSVTPSLSSTWFDNSNTFPRTVATFTISTGWWIFGSSTKFYWIARFAYVPDPPGTTDTTSGTDVTIPAPIPVRDFIDGFEIIEHGGGSVNAGRGYSRAGAITGEGMGFAYRNGGASALTRDHQFATALNKHYAWNRFYVRLRHLPSAATEIFRFENFGAGGSGARLAVAADGKLAMYVTDGTTFALVSTTPGQLVVGRRQRLDVLGYVGDDGLGAAICVMHYWLDGTYLGSSTNSPGGLVANAKILILSLGKAQTGASTLEIDFDDWHCATVPDDKLFRTAAYAPASTYVLGNLVTYTGVRPAGVALPDVGFEMFRALGAVPINTPPRHATTGVMDTANWVKLTDSVDWLLGSRIVLLDNTGLAVSANWTIPDYRLISSPFVRQAATGGATSSTSAAILATTTNALTRLANVRGAVGWVAVNVGVESNKSAGLDGSAGYKIGGAAAVYVPIVPESSTGGWGTALYSPAALQAPETVVAVEAHYQKGADANASRVRCLMATAEVCGVFSACDVTPGSAAASLPPPRGAHNAPYFDTPWVQNADPPLSPVVLKAGTYTGNGTGQNLTFSAPVHFLTIRPLTGDVGGTRYFAAAPAPQKVTYIGAGNDYGQGYAQRDASFTPASDTADQQMQFVFPIAGTDTQVNAVGVVYQYVAFCDPGARFLLNGATYHEAAAGLLPVTDALEVSDFLATFGLFWRFDLSVTSTDDLWVKGTGHTTAQASKSGTGTPVASALTFGTGTLISDSGFVDTTARFGTVYALWRQADGNGDPNQAKVCAVGTYVGDGNATRTVPIAPASGLRPLYVIVQPHNNVALHRDPSHTGTTSTLLPSGTANAATGITAGAIDGFVVGSVLNANGITYSWFAILGSATAGQNGWSINGEFTPIASDSPIDPAYLDPPDSFEDTPAPEEEPEPDSDAEPDLSLACVAATQRLVNRALARIGESQQVTALATATTVAAVLARLHFHDDAETTLRDYDWPFATRYADLVLVGGTATVPVNGDWQYSYRAPTGMVKARRIVPQSGTGRTFDPDPIPFRVGSDATGPLLYANVAIATDVPVQLEYTFRVTCPASQGDALFRNALCWRHAASLAMPLARDSKKQAFCLAMYHQALVDAEAPAANESEPEPDGDAAWIRGR